MNSIEVFSEWMDEYYDSYPTNVDELKQFYAYCEAGKNVNGVTPVYNPINFYAWRMGVTSQESEDLLFNND